MAYTHRDLTPILREQFNLYFLSMPVTSGKWNGVPTLEFSDDCSNESLPEDERIKMIENQSVDYYLERLELITDHDFYLNLHEWITKMDSYTTKEKVQVLGPSGPTPEVLAMVEQQKKDYRIREAIIEEVTKKFRVDDFEDDARQAVHEAMRKYSVAVSPDK